MATDGQSRYDAEQPCFSAAPIAEVDQPVMARRVLLVCGVLSSVLYLTAIDALAPLVHPGHHAYTSQMVSELMALGAPTRPLLMLPMLLYNLLVFAFAAGVWASAEGRRPRVFTAAALVGYGVCSSAGLWLAPMDLRSAGVSDQTLLHIWGTALQGLFIALALVFGVFVHTGRFRLYSVATFVICIVFGAFASLEAAQAEMRWIGLTERVNIYAWMLWLAALAVSLWPAQVPSAAPLWGPTDGGEAHGHQSQASPGGRSLGQLHHHRQRDADGARR
jgi:hypothetical protein